MTRQVSNPFSTGGGGTTFEHLVGTYYLISLLARDIPRGLPNGICSRVAFQQSWSDAILDDVVVTSLLQNGSQLQLMLQVKHNITISNAPSNDLFRRVMSDCWQTFEQQKGDFDPQTDRIGIATGTYNTQLDSQLQPLLDWARTAVSSEDFTGRVMTPQFASNGMRGYYNIFKNILSEVAKRAPSEEEIWKFLKCFVYIDFQLEHEGARDSYYVKNRALDQLALRSSDDANHLISSLQGLVAEYGRAGGELDASNLRQQLNTYALKESADCNRDLSKLHAHTDRVLNRIETTIGQRIHLPRVGLVSDTYQAIQENDFVAILGEPGSGKSVLLKSLVQRLRAQGEVLVTSIDNLSGTNLDEFMANLRIEHDFQTLLSAFSAAPIRCLFIDRLEQILFNEQHRQVLYDLIDEVIRHNDGTNSTNGSARWRIVATCRTEQYFDILPRLPQSIIRANSTQISVPRLEEFELEVVVEAFPAFHHLSVQPHIQGLLHNPFILNLLTFPELNLVDFPTTKLLTESWLIELYWRQIVRNSEVIDRGDPNIREQTTIELGELRLGNGRTELPRSQLSSLDTVQFLVHDRVIQQTDARISFLHDILDDWTLSKILSMNLGRITDYLKVHSESVQLIRPLRLLALKQLELDESAEQWYELLDTLQSDSELALRWYQTVLTAPLTSPMLKSLLEIIEPGLLANNGRLLSNLIRALRTIQTVPSKFILNLLDNASGEKSRFEKLLAESRDPVPVRWIPVWEMLFRYQDAIPIQALPEIAEAANLWMKTIAMPLREEVGRFCVILLDSDFQQRLRAGYYGGGYVTISSRSGWIDDQVVRRLQQAVLAGADCLSKEVQELLYRLLENSDSQLAHLLFGRGSQLAWLLIAKEMPQLFADITLKIFCNDSEPETFTRDGQVYYPTSTFRDTAIKNDSVWGIDFNRDVKDIAPFYYFLKMHPADGVKLIVELVNFATTKWVESLRREGNHTPIPQMVKLSTHSQEFWGDANIYNWWQSYQSPYRTIEYALQSLRQWLNEFLSEQNRQTPTEIFDIVLSRSNSFAIVAVCVLVASEDIEQRASALLPILEQPAFWQIDNYRTKLSMMYGQRDNLYDFAGIAHYILFSDMNHSQRLQEALKQFPNNVPYFYEEEKLQPDLVEKRRQYVEQIAAMGDLENYRFVQQDDKAYLQLVLPEHIEQRIRNQQEPLDLITKLSRLQNWAVRVSKGEECELSLEQVVQDAREIENSVDDDDLRTQQALAEVCGALIIADYTWLKENDHLSWCRQKVLEAVFYKNPDNSKYEPITGLFHIIAKMLPALVVANPQDTEAIDSIFHLIGFSRTDEDKKARENLFGALKPLWEIDSGFVMQCCNFLVSRAEFEMLRRRRSRKSEEIDETEVQIELSTEVPSLSQLDSDLVYWLYPIPMALPNPEAASYKSDDSRILTFLDEIVSYNNKLHMHSQMTDNSREHRLFQVPVDWNQAINGVFVAWSLYLPFDLVCKHILDPTIAVWKDGAGALEGILHALLMSTKDSSYKDRFIEIWKHVIPSIIVAKPSQSNPLRIREIVNTYANLLLIVRPEIVWFDVWTDCDWNPTIDLVDEISLWVREVGYYRDTFFILMRMLNTVGTPIRVPYGVNWLYESFERVDSPDNLFRRKSDYSELSELLHKIWYENHEFSEDPQLLDRFTRLVDYLAGKGDQIAVELQRRIQS